MSKIQLKFDSDNPSMLRNLMKEYGDIEYPLFGKNDQGEDTEIHISKDSIIYKTYQSNGWLRVNYYGEDGYPEGESFEGKWSK